MADNYMTFNDAVEVLTPYAEKINTIKPESITWAAYQLLTSEQKAAKRYLITDYPSPTGYVNKLSDLEDVSINSQTLSNGQVPVYNSTNEVWENKTILENSLTSTATDVALTAAQGKVLQDTKQAKTLTIPITINGTQETTVEGALSGLNNYGDALADNLTANENVYGAKNLWNIEKWFNDIGQAFTKSGDVYTTTISDMRTNTNKCVFSDTDIEVTLSAELTASGSMRFYVELFDSNDNNVGSISLSNPTFTGIGCKVRFNFNNTGTVTLTAPMIRDARIIDPTFAPYAETNLQLTNDVASIFDILPNNAGAHNRYRGKALTIDADFWAHISDGTFENQFVGDTITLNGRTYHLAHPDYWINTGDTNCTTHHWAVVSPILGTSKINDAGGVVGGYAGSDFRTGNNSITGLADALALIKADFGAAHILSHRELLDNAVTGGYPSSGNWFDSEAELMSQVQVYGNKCFEPGTNLGQTIPYVFTVDKTQFALFTQRPDLISTRSSWWLRDVVSAARFALVGSDGHANSYGTSFAFGIRLAFGIIA